MLLLDFFNDIYAPRRLRGKSQRSYVLYRLGIARYSESLGKPATLADLTNEAILDHLNRRSNVAAATRNKELAELSALWRFAVQRGLATGWPEIQAEPEPARTPQAWTHEDVLKLLTACRAANGTIGAAPASVFWTAFVRFSLDTGERVGAILQARWDWLESTSIMVPAEARKGKTRDKWFPLSEDTLGLLQQLRRYRTTDQIFHWPYCSTYFWTRYRQIVASAGLPTGRRSSTHRTRKTVASVAHAAGMDATEVLDHSDRRTTQRYLDPKFSRQTKASEVLAAWLRTPPAARRKLG